MSGLTLTFSLMSIGGFIHGSALTVNGGSSFESIMTMVLAMALAGMAGGVSQRKA